jgi:hypothetical protein
MRKLSGAGARIPLAFLFEDSAMTWNDRWSVAMPGKAARGKHWMGVGAVVLAMVVPMLAQTGGRAGRINGELGAGATVAVAGSVHPLTRRASDLGAVNPAMRMESLTLNASLGAAEQAELNALLEAQQDAKSPQFHRWLTQEEYGARFGLTDADLNAVSGWLKQQGFTVKGVSRSRNAIYFGGTAGQVEAAFRTQLHRYELNGEVHFANATGLRVPAGIASVLLNVRGLNDFRLKPKVRKRALPGYTVGTSQGIMNFLVPADWATIYNVNAIYDAGYTGSGMYVGVVGQTYAPEQDIINFRSAAGLTAPLLSYVCIDPVAANCTGAAAISDAGDLDEADLDIEWSGGIAKDATVVFVYAPWSDVCSNVPCTAHGTDPVTEQTYGVFDALQRAVEDYTVPATGQVLPVISMSYSDCEESLVGDPGYVQWVTAVGEEANAQGQTIVVASGDTGPAGCDAQYDYPASQGVSVSVPVDSPNYTGVGGTTLSGDENDPAEYWIQTLNTVDSALRYIPETAWNDTLADDAEGYPGLSASGGGVSLYYAQPAWQPAPGNYSGTGGRFVPDVAFAASPDHDGYMYCSSADNTVAYGTTCASGFLSSEGYFYFVGGTSAPTPSFAGVLTLLAQKYGNFGNINPTLYGLAANATSYAAVFHDITGGNNIVPCEVETSDVGCVNSAMGWEATVGYDLVTGLGSLDAYALYTALIAPTTMTVAAAPGSVAFNGTTTLTATVSSTAAGAIRGQVTFKVGNSTLGATALEGGVATLAGVAVTAANGFSSGSNTITASFAGDANFAAASATTGLTVAAGSTTTTVTATPGSIALGSAAATENFTATVTGSGLTPAGTVAFRVGAVTVAASVALDNGVATLTEVAATAANGFTVGSNTVTATFTPASDLLYVVSGGSTELTVTAPAYAITPPVNPIALSAGGSGQATVALASTSYAGTVNWTASCDSTAITVSPAGGSTTLAANHSVSIRLTIRAAESAAKRAPRLPWGVGAMAAGTLLAGLPLAGWRRRGAAALLAALTIVALALALGCSGSGGGSPTPAARQYTVTITGTGGIRATIPVSVE